MTLKIEIIIALLFAIIVWCLRWAFIGLPALAGDGPMYLAMAGGAEGSPPWSYHILTPRLAGFLSGRHPRAGFFGIAAFSFGLASAAIVIMLRAGSFETEFRERVLGAALFMAVYPGVAMFRSFFLTDSLSYALLAVACAALVHRRDGVLALTTLVGIFNRETALFVVPVWFVWNIEQAPFRRVILKSAFVFGPAVAGYVLLHHTPLFFGHEPDQFNYLRADNMNALWHSNLSWLGTDKVFYGLAVCVFLSYGPTWFVAAYGYSKSLFVLRDATRRPLLALAGLALPSAAALLVVDWRRGFQPLFPAVVAATVIGLRVFTAGLPRGSWYLGAGGTVLAANVITEAWWGRKISIPVGVALSLWMCLMASIVVRTRRGVPSGSARKSEDAM